MLSNMYLISFFQDVEMDENLFPMKSKRFGPGKIFYKTGKYHVWKKCSVNTEQVVNINKA